MTTSLDVANHWPFIRRHLQLHRRQKRFEKVLWALALRQAASNGDLVSMSEKQLLAHAMTGGEAGRARMVLRALEERGVVKSVRAGRGKLWTFQGDIGHWRLPWWHSRREVARAVSSCVCSTRALWAPPARLAGQSVADPRGRTVFLLTPNDHLDFWGHLRAVQPPNRADRAHDRGGDLAEARGSALALVPPIPCFSELTPTAPRSEEEERISQQRLRRVCRAVSEVSKGHPTIYGGPPLRKAQAIAEMAGERLDELLRALLGEAGPFDRFDEALAFLEQQLVELPAVEPKARARWDPKILRAFQEDGVELNEEQLTDLAAWEDEQATEEAL
ncbi:MAG TPA: hypothetical protein VMR97_07830 [Acidimicrobiales bacterium]|nr:hypothetical protein [Acidimicrobiales bacterium]